MLEIENIDYVVCQVCQRKMLKIPISHLRKHNIDKKDYIIKFPDKALKCKNTLDKEILSGIKGSELSLIKYKFLKSVKLENHITKKCKNCNNDISYDNRDNNFCSRKCFYENCKLNAKMKHDWNEIQRYYNSGYSLQECMKKYKFSIRTYQRASDRGVFKARTHQEAITLSLKSGAMSKVDRTNVSQETRKYLGELAIKRNLGGETNYKKFIYNNIYMDSSWEVKIAKFLDKNNIRWERDKKYSFPWLDKNGKCHRYYPDFFLPDYNVYLDPKNKYLMIQDEYKLKTVIETHNINLIYGSIGSIKSKINKIITG